MLGNILRLYRENGALLTLRAMYNRALRRIFNHFVALKLPGAENLSLRPNAVLAGLAHISIGKNFIAGDFLKLEAVTRFCGQGFEPRIVIKDNVSLNDFVHIGATNYIEIGNNVLMASKIFISDHNHGSYRGEGQTPPSIPPAERALTCGQQVIIGDNVWIGELVAILPGSVIGQGAIIGANSVVSGEIPPFSIAVGAPARVVKTFNHTTGLWELPARTSQGNP
jgi:acetyltransferase-like isoleucine patch superfamily enzyme